MNLTTFRVWCYACEKEVFLDQRLAVHTQSPSVKFSETVGVCQPGRAECLAGFLFPCCKISQGISIVVQAAIVVGTLSLKVAACGQRTNSFALQNLPAGRLPMT